MERVCVVLVAEMVVVVAEMVVVAAEMRGEGEESGGGVKKVAEV